MLWNTTEYTAENRFRFCRSDRSFPVNTHSCYVIVTWQLCRNIVPLHDTEFVQKNGNQNFRNIYVETKFWALFLYTLERVSLNQRKISLIYSQRKNFFELKKVFLIEKNVLWSKEIDLFTLKTFFWIEKTFFNSILSVKGWYIVEVMHSEVRRR